MNAVCDRCSGPKAAGTATLWCDACVALPACEGCGTPLVDGRDPDCSDCDEAACKEWEDGYEGRCDSIAAQRYEEAAYGRPDYY